MFDSKNNGSAWFDFVSAQSTELFCTSFGWWRTLDYHLDENGTGGPSRILNESGFGGVRNKLVRHLLVLVQGCQVTAKPPPGAQKIDPFSSNLAKS